MALSVHKIDVGGLLAGGRQRLVVDEQVPLAEFEGVTFPEPARVHLDIQGSGEALEIGGTIDVRLGGECIRCLGEAGREMHLDVDERIELPGGRGAAPLEESNVLSGDRLDVADLTSQLVCSAIPMGLLCKEDCEGICPHCGENKNMNSCVCARERRSQNG